MQDSHILFLEIFQEMKGFFSADFYASLPARLEQSRADLEAALQGFHTVAAYGAAAKGIVLLNTFDLDAHRIPWVADLAPSKQGRFVPGTAQPIVPPQFLLHLMPQGCLLLPWNLRDEILQQNREYTDRGGRFILPLPEVRIL